MNKWNKFIRFLALVTLIITVYSPTVLAQAPLNSDVALTPPKDGWIIRTQFRYSSFSNDPTPLDREVNLSVVPFTFVYGATENLALLGNFRIVRREINFGSGGTDRDSGFADIRMLGKYRFYQDDQRSKTTRWAAIGGLEIPTFDDGFSSDSFDPIIGTVWTHQELDWEIDWDLLYKFNTAGGVSGDDEFRADTTVTYRLLGGVSETSGPWGFYAVGELNASYLTDGSTELQGSPGLQYITPNFIIEAGVQLPLDVDMKSPRLERDFTLIFSVRLQF